MATPHACSTRGRTNGLTRGHTRRPRSTPHLRPHRSPLTFHPHPHPRPHPHPHQAVETKGDLEDQIALLEKEIDARKAEASDLTALCVSLEHREEQRNKTYEVRSKELTDLSAEKLQLEALLETLRKSKPEPKGDAKK